MPVAQKIIKLVILRNETKGDHDHWIDACKKIKGKVQYIIVDLTKSKWLEQIINFNPDILLTKPGGLTAPLKQLYDERLMVLVKELGFKCFPTLNEVLIYENKRYFSYWLKANSLPHPETDVFYFKEEAVDFIKAINYPVVGKTNIGASGSGVVFLQNFKQAEEYVNQIFSGKGAAKRSGPNLEKGAILRRGFHYLLNPGDISSKLHIYKARATDIQRDFVIFQKYIPHDFEWRAVRIGNSFFAHKKLKNGEKTSGTLLKNYDNPPLKIFDFVKTITDRFDFYSQAIDIFEFDNRYLVNEMQCIFGQSDSYQMLVDGKPGRYIVKGGKWIFEEGDFASNQCYDQRVEFIVECMKNKI